MLEMETRHRDELETLKQEKGSLQTLVGRQSGVIGELETQLNRATGNSTALQRQQQEMMDTVHNLLNLCSKDGGKLNGIKVLLVERFGRCSAVPGVTMVLLNGSFGSRVMLRKEMKKVITY